ncbi:molybdate ABC transporter permease subunit [Pelagibius litoralis]|uniref:Molybdenum transport system permease n=1 Tax=Pelagibius litoralis TaxID=374515 RepID=A0A967C9T8_9PROT|nr:molybdate ABC transporter permease subunit [Pelagibius litoralis]NIA67183.1 molybdate ABC transporter permease subunit [Pelagibius litoralis]
MFELTALESEAIRLSLRVAFWSVTASLPFGLAAAWLLQRYDFYGKTLLNGIIHLPLVLPPVVVGYLLLILLGRRGPLGSWLYETFGISLPFTWEGAALAAAVMAFPLMVRAIRLSIETIDQNLETAARTLGASRLSVFLTITLPLIAPGILAGCVLAFARSLGEFGATITFVSNIPGETRTLPLALYSLIQTPDGETGALRLAVLSVILSLAALGASEIIERRLRARLID